MLILDEPTASLDPDVAIRVRDQLAHLNEVHDTTLLLTSHDMREVETLTERVAVPPGGAPGGRRPDRDGRRRRRASIPRGHVPGRGLPAPEPVAVTHGPHRGPRNVSRRRVAAVVRRHGLAQSRNPGHWFLLLVLPVVDTLLFVSIGVAYGEGDGAAQILLTGILLFHVVWQLTLAGSMGFLEEVWSRNVLNLFTTPLHEREYASALGIVGLVRTLVAVLARRRSSGSPSTPRTPPAPAGYWSPAP